MPSALIYDFTAKPMASVADSHHFSGVAGMMSGLGGILLNRCEECVIESPIEVPLLKSCFERKYSF